MCVCVCVCLLVGWLVGCLFVGWLVSCLFVCLLVVVVSFLTSVYVGEGPSEIPGYGFGSLFLWGVAPNRRNPPLEPARAFFGRK